MILLSINSVVFGEFELDILELVKNHVQDQVTFEFGGCLVMEDPFVCDFSVYYAAVASVWMQKKLCQ